MFTGGRGGSPIGTPLDLDPAVWFWLIQMIHYGHMAREICPAHLVDVHKPIGFQKVLHKHLALVFPGHDTLACCGRVSRCLSVAYYL